MAELRFSDWNYGGRNDLKKEERYKRIHPKIL